MHLLSSKEVRTYECLGGVCTEIQKAVIHGSYKKHLLENTKFRDYCRAAVNTSHERIFLYFLELGDEKENTTFNIVCQKLMTHLLLCLDTVIGLNKRNMQSSFWFNFHEFLASATFSLILQTLNPRMQSRIFLAAVLFFLVTYFEDIMMQCVTKQDNNDTPYNPSTFESYAKMQRFVGWAIYSREKNVQKKLRELKDKRDNKSGGNKKLTETIASLEMENEILISMTTYEKEIKEDKEYMTGYYPTAFCL